MKTDERYNQELMKTDERYNQELMKTDKELHREFLKLGANRRKLTNELLALLPEVFDRKIYLKYAATIIEYAGKFGGLSKGVVLKRLRLEKYLSDKPKLRDAIKTEGIHKVALVASVATAETEEAWVDKLKNMSKNAIQELSKEVRNKEIENEKKCFGNGDLLGGLGERDNLDADFGEGGLFDDGEIGKNNSVSFEDSCLSYRRQMASLSTLCKAAPLKITIELTDETAFLFLKLKKKFEKEMGANGRFLNNKEVIGEILKRLADAEFSEKVSEKVVAENDEKHAAEKVILEDNFCKGEVRGEKIGGNKKTILEDNFCKGKFADEEKENKTEILESGSMDKPIEQKNESEKYRQKISRYIPVHVKKMAILRARGKCAYPNCGHPAEIFHHRERFAESKKRLERGMNEGDKMRPDDADKRLKQAVHESVVPFCRTHHEFAHNGIIANESQNSEQWTLEIGQANFSRADVLYREIRQENIKN